MSDAAASASCDLAVWSYEIAGLSLRICSDTADVEPLRPAYDVFKRPAAGDAPDISVESLRGGPDLQRQPLAGELPLPRQPAGMFGTRHWCVASLGSGDLAFHMHTPPPDPRTWRIAYARATRRPAGGS